MRVTHHRKTNNKAQKQRENKKKPRENIRRKIIISSEVQKDSEWVSTPKRNQKIIKIKK